MKYTVAVILSLIVVVRSAAVNDVLKVTTVLNKPFVTLIDESKESNPSAIKNEDFDGYMIDLLRLLSSKVKFNYEIKLAKDSLYGSDKDGNWNGMIGEVIRNEADLALADLTITAHRSQVIDFSYPFMMTGIGLLAKRPPYYTCEKNSSSAATRDCHLNVYPVNDMHDLVNQNVVKYGVVGQGSTEAFFKHSNDVVFKKIGKNLQPMKSVHEGVERVRSSDGDFMFFMEQTSIDYLKAKSCDFIKLGRGIKRSGYGIGMRPNYELRSKINVALLELDESGKLQELKSKWWPHEKHCDTRLDSVFVKNALRVVLDSIK